MKKLIASVLALVMAVSMAACAQQQEPVPTEATKPAPESIKPAQKVIHVLVPENAETEPEFLKELVFDANQSAVGLIDLLSYNIYYYDRLEEKMLIYEVK